MTESFTHTVLCFTDKGKRKNFTNKQEAIDYANSLLREGHKCKVYPYRPPKKYIDIMLERMAKEGRL